MKTLLLLVSLLSINCYSQYGLNENSKNLYKFWSQKAKADFSINRYTGDEYLTAIYSGVRQEFYFDKNENCNYTILWFNDRETLYSILDELKISDSKKEILTFYNQKPVRVIIYKQNSEGKILYSVSLYNSHEQK